MKKTLFVAAAFLLSVSLLHAATETKLEKTFNETFPSAANAKWTKDANGYMVSFTQGGTLMRICYTNEGKFASSLRYYGAKDLPTNILLSVKGKYQGKDIIGVTEYTSSDEVVYFIKLYDGKDYYAIKAYSDGSITNDDSATAANADDNGK